MGLPPGRLALLGAAGAVTAAVLRTGLPEGLRIMLAAAALGAGALLAWGRVLELPLTSWALRVGFWLVRRAVQRAAAGGPWEGGSGRDDP